MLSGATEIFRCPLCHNYISRGTISSGNTFGAVYYSDGKQVAPMLPEIIQITKCRNCGNIFWITDENIIDTIQSWEINSKYTDIQKADFLNVDDYIVALHLNLFDSEEQEFFLRLRLWWEFNNSNRYNKSQSNSDKIIWRNKREKKYWKENILRLIELFDKNSDDKKLIVAELYRNLGEFEKSIELLNEVVNTDYDWVVNTMEEECKKKNTRVIQLN
ncbi:MAG: hypothetical protein ABFS12_13355 [Bacteroidota bacterium]